MRRRELLPSILVFVSLAACGKEASTPKGDGAPAAHSHPPAPHGGEVQEMGQDEYHLEMIHDHDGGHVTVYVLEKDLKTAVRVPAPVIQVNAKGGPVQFTLTAVNPGPDGTAEAWKGSHDGLKVDPWDGTIRIQVRGKQFRNPLEGPVHTHEPAGAKPSGALPMPAPGATAAAAEHSHDPRHGGRMIELGEHEGHLEVVHDAKTGTLTAYVYDADMNPVASEAPMINLATGGVQVQMTRTAGSGPTSDSWKATHDGLKVDPLVGRIRVKIGAKTYQASL
jgi:hypothetical protein